VQRKLQSLVAKSQDAIPEVSMPSWEDDDWLRRLQIQAVRQNVDPLLSVFTPIRSGRLVSVTTGSEILIASISHLYKLANFPVTIHVALHPDRFADYSAITAIRNAGWTFLQSESLQETQDMALTAHALSLRSGKGVIHFFSPGTLSDDKPIDPESVDVVRRILNLDNVRRFQAAHLGGVSIYADDGRVAVIAEQSEAPITQSLPGSNSINRDTPDLATAAEDQSSKASEKSSSQSWTGSPPSVSPATTVEAQAVPVTSEDIYQYASTIWEQLENATGRAYNAFEWSGPAHAENCLFIFGADAGLFSEAIDNAQGTGNEYEKLGIITPRLYRPWIGATLLRLIPRSVKRIAVLEQISRKTTKWGPTLLDVLTSVKSGQGGVETIVGYQVGYITQDTVNQALRGICQNLSSGHPIQNLHVGAKDGPEEPKPIELGKPQLETAYTKILSQLFGDRVYVANALGVDDAGVSPSVSAAPEFGFGSLMARRERRLKFIAEMKHAASTESFLTQRPNRALRDWASVANDPHKAAAVADEVVSLLTIDGSSTSRAILSKKDLFRKESLWLVGSDAWAYDLGNSGVHHVLSSGENVNMLIIDSTPYSERAAADAHRRKKDIGLYAMNFGNAYVASVAVYSSYTQVLQAMDEADRFNGPSIVLAYLPYFGEHDSPLTVLQETKTAVDIGYWPLYRWNPNNETNGAPNFSLDSERVKKELKEFLARDNQLTQLMQREPIFASSVSQDYGTEVRAQQKRKAKDAYNQLLAGLLGAPLTILFASDNGNAESLAKRLGNRGRARGLKTAVMAMEDYPVEDLPSEENIVFISSTAGQGEFPQNGRAFWDAVKDSTELDLASVNFSVMALGDSHYWPRKEDKIYYNKPGKDLDRILANFGAKRLADIGLGDDQDPDGFQTGYQEWEPKIWQALGVANVEGLPEEPPPVTNEDIKLASNYLRGTIAEGLQDTTTGAISAADQQLTKFHGTYMQDDRDLRDERKAQGLEPAYSFMIRCRLPGGVATPEQWIRMDDISTTLGNETMKLTTRQTFQFHGVVKGKLKPAMQAINKALMTTIAACGDVNRNVMCSSLPNQSRYHREVYACSKKISDHLLPSTSAYHEIWLTDDDGKRTQVAGDAVQDFEPLYGPTYLPRKFKISIGIPPHNDTDVYAHDIGLIAIRGDDGHLDGFNLLAGGGMGATHNMKKTYPQIGRSLGFVKATEVHIACEKVMLVQRDYGDRKNRKHARLKYTIDDMGVDVFRSRVEDMWGQNFGKPKPFHFDSNIDSFGWIRDETGMNHFTFFIENGRVEDTAAFQMKTGLRELAKVHKGEFRLTGNQHLILSNVADEDKLAIERLMKQYKLDNIKFSGLRLSSSACVAFPTCGLAMAESERYLPELINKLEGCLEENGLRQDSIVMRMTGCPNGCARPWLAEVAFVGKAYGAYNMYLGGGYHGQRLGKLYRSSIKEDEILAIMKPLLKRYALERQEGEHFGDFCIRIGIIKETREGRDFHDDVSNLSHAYSGFAADHVEGGRGRVGGRIASFLVVPTSRTLSAWLGAQKTAYFGPDHCLASLGSLVIQFAHRAFIPIK
jgi:sulfite reductase (NADPH) hemoprotein beta-component